MPVKEASPKPNNTMAFIFDFDADYILENEAVKLRPLKETDIEFLLPFALNEPAIWQFSLVQAAGAENMQRYIESALQSRADQKEYPFIVFDKKQKQYAGCTRFYDIQLQNQTLQLGFLVWKTFPGNWFKQTLQVFIA